MNLGLATAILGMNVRIRSGCNKVAERGKKYFDLDAFRPELG